MHIADTLVTARSLYAAAADRAATAWVQVQALRDMRLVVPCHLLIDILSEAAFSDRLNTCDEPHESLTECREEVIRNLDIVDFEITGVEGAADYVFRPFLSAPLNYFSELRLSYLTIGDDKLLKVLNVERQNFDHLGTVYEGLTEEEVQTLIEGYRAKSKRLVNGLRDLFCFLNYVENGITKDLPRVFGTSYSLPDGDPLKVIARLLAICEVPGLPPTPTYFSSHNDTLITLSDLPGSAAELAAALTLNKQLT